MSIRPPPKAPTREETVCAPFVKLAMEQRDRDVAALRRRASKLENMSDLELVRAESLDFARGMPEFERAVRTARVLLDHVDVAIDHVSFRPTIEQELAWLVYAGSRERRVSGEELVEAWNKATR